MTIRYAIIVHDKHGKEVIAACTTIAGDAKKCCPREGRVEIKVCEQCDGCKGRCEADSALLNTMR